MSIRDHAKSIRTRLEQDDVLASCTYEGVVTERPSRYCTFYMDSGQREQDRFTGPQSLEVYGVTVHSVGTTAEQAQFVADRVFAQLLGFTPAIDGRSVRRIRHVSSQPVQLDRDVSPPLYYCTDQFDLTSAPA